LQDGGLSKPLCDLFEYHVNNPNFEVASDAFETLTAMLMQNKGMVFECLNPNGDAASLARYGELFGMYNRLLQSDNYVLKRQSLKLLSELLLDRDNFAIMMRYIVDRGNLKIIMTLLRHNQPNIQFEAFHVFKVFVANPEKPNDIVEILALNKARLIAFLRGFQNEKGE
jgi:calcium binding protein 39